MDDFPAVPRRFCPVCGQWTADTFRNGPGARPDARCPHCKSLERQRFLAVLTSCLMPAVEPVGTLLEIAPAPCTTQVLGELAPLRHVRMDIGYDGRGVDLLGSVTDIPLRRPVRRRAGLLPRARARSRRRRGAARGGARARARWRGPGAGADQVRLRHRRGPERAGRGAGAAVRAGRPRPLLRRRLRGPAGRRGAGLHQGLAAVAAGRAGVPGARPDPGRVGLGGAQRRARSTAGSPPSSYPRPPG